MKSTWMKSTALLLFYVPSGEPQTNEQKTEQLRQQATELRKPREPPLSGKDAHVWIHKNQQSGEITVTSKGVVEVVCMMQGEMQLLQSRMILDTKELTDYQN